MPCDPRRAPLQRQLGRFTGAMLAAGCIAACRGEPTADLTGREAWSTAGLDAPVPAFAADAAAGGRRFAVHCTACHGAAGGCDGPLAAGLSPPPPDWTAADALQTRSPATLYLAIRRGVLGSSMKRFDHVLDEPTTWDVVFHIWRMPVAAASHLSGADAYARRCAACHGPAGRPEPPSPAPSLVRPGWVALTRADLVERLVRAHPDIVAGPAGVDADPMAAPIAEHLWSFLTVPAPGTAHGAAK